MKYYLVDYENVKVDGLNGITQLSEKDIVCIFYSKNADGLTFGLHRRLNESKAQITYQKVEVGLKNALDFQLSSYLGYIIHENLHNKVQYFIVTQDHGFSSLVNYWKRRKVKVALVSDMGENQKKKAADSPKIREKIPSQREQLEQLVQDKVVAEVVAELMQKCDTKQQVHAGLQRAFPSEQSKTASMIYAQIKPLLTDKEGR